MIKSNINSLVDKKKILIGIIGLGYVGLPLAILFSKKKYKLIGFDIDKKKLIL